MGTDKDSIKKMSFFQRHHQTTIRTIVFFHDIGWVAASIYFAYLLRFNFEPIPDRLMLGMQYHILVSMLCFPLAWWFSRLPQGMWQFFSILDMTSVLRSVALAIGAAVAISALLFRLEGVPRTVLVLQPILLTVCLLAPRIAFRLGAELLNGPSNPTLQRALIVGAGRSGDLLLRQLHSHGHYLGVGFADDDPLKRGKRIHGVPVLGGINDIPKIAKATQCDVILASIPSADNDTMNRILVQCGDANIPFRVLPTLTESPDQAEHMGRLRSLMVEDLLGRKMIDFPSEIAAKSLKGKVVLVTGGGGSIGTELCNQIAMSDVSRLIVLDVSEFNLFTVEQALLKRFPNKPISSVLGNIQNKEAMSRIFREYRPDIVYHAAAYKHVPLLEGNPLAAISNNIFGTMVLADCAIQNGCKQFIYISTDKAVNPNNVLGASKRAGELYCQALNMRSETDFIVTRFGNVLRSAGSVYETFERQIREGGPVTVTHADVERYFMTKSEAVHLILEAGAIGHGGELLVLEMGSPVKIDEMARQMIRLAGYEVGKTMHIVYTGLRPGEKIREELFYDSESHKTTQNKKLLLADAGKVNPEDIKTETENLIEASSQGDLSMALFHLHRLIPEFESMQQEISHKTMANTNMVRAKVR